MFHHPAHNFDMTFSERSHQTGNFTIILTVNVCSSIHQKLNHVKMATCKIKLTHEKSSFEGDDHSIQD